MSKVFLKQIFNITLFKKYLFSQIKNKRSNLITFGRVIDIKISIRNNEIMQANKNFKNPIIRKTIAERSRHWVWLVAI